MFVIGLEFNLPKLRSMRRWCSARLAQVVLTIAGAAPRAGWLGYRGAGAGKPGR